MDRGIRSQRGISRAKDDAAAEMPEVDDAQARPFRGLASRSMCALALFGALSGTQAAASGEISAVMNGITGVQAQSKDRTSLPVAVLPSFATSSDIGRWRLFVEGTPPLGPVAYGDDRLGARSTELGYLGGEIRYAWKTLTLGMGVSVLNQRTAYAHDPPITEQVSRVAGFRLSIGDTFARSDRGDFNAMVSFNPRMHGLQFTQYNGPVTLCPYPVGPCRSTSSSIENERASLFDLQVTRNVFARRLIFRYGLRYMNYAARFFPGGATADRERLMMPFAGVAIPW